MVDPQPYFVHLDTNYGVSIMPFRRWVETPPHLLPLAFGVQNGRMPPELELRDLEAPDLLRLIEWIPTADALLRWAGPGFSFPLTLDQLELHLASAGERRRILKGVWPPGEMVGHVELAVLPEHEVASVGRVLVAPDLRGRGIGTALMREVVRLGFDGLGLHRLELSVFDFNLPAIRCYERVGFRREGLAREARKGSNGYWNVVRMGMIESDPRGRA
jgi:RimJ/RimL family protein N-acetyltransferase